MMENLSLLLLRLPLHFFPPCTFNPFARLRTFFSCSRCPAFASDCHPCSSVKFLSPPPPITRRIMPSVIRKEERGKAGGGGFIASKWRLKRFHSGIPTFDFYGSHLFIRVWCRRHRHRFARHFRLGNIELDMRRMGVTAGQNECMPHAYFIDSERPRNCSIFNCLGCALCCVRAPLKLVSFVQRGKWLPQTRL